MKKLILIPFGLFFHFICLSQDQDHWDVYITQHEKGPGSTLVNLSVKKLAPDKSMRYLLVTGVRYKKCKTDGMPEQNEFENLYKISDAVNSVVKELLKENKLVGTFTYDCQRLDYYYVSDTNKVRDTLSLMYKLLYPNYSFSINIREDSNWSVYLDVLYPNDLALEAMSNQQVVLKLHQSGDDLTKSRQVDHWLYFPTIEDSKKFSERIKEMKFVIDTIKYVDQGPLHYQLHIHRDDKIDVASISKLTLFLKQEAKKYNGDYDGWETFVVK